MGRLNSDPAFLDHLGRTLYAPKPYVNEGFTRGYAVTTALLELVLNLADPGAPRHELIPFGEPPAAAEPPRVAHGRFIFVIRQRDPGRILCARSNLRIAGKMIGHITLANREAVQYAGEMAFTHGQLDWWSNASGHYTPDGTRFRNNVHPQLRRVLPAHKFSPFVAQPW